MKQGKSESKFRRHIFTAGAVLFWLLIWQILSMKIQTKILFASPFSVFEALLHLIRTEEFWKSVAFSCLRMAAGFLLSFAVGGLLAVFSAFCNFFRELLAPLMNLIKAIPVASFVILALLWISSKNLSVLISFLMVLPVIYFNVLQGIQNTDNKLLQMAEVFRMKKIRRFRYIYLPSVLPYLVTACSVGLGFCWKSGVAAEVIGIPADSIGRRLYEAKLYLMTEELFAWTFVIVSISLIFEKIVMLAIRRTVRYFSRNTVRLNTGTGQTAQSRQAAGSPSSSDRSNTEEKCAPGAEMARPMRGRMLQAVGAGITLEHITKAYNGKTVLDDLTLHIPAGRTTCIMGASGIGKTTLLNLLMGLEQPDSGKSDGLAGMRIAAVFQEDRLCSGLDAVSNAALLSGAGVAREDIIRELRTVGIEEFEGKPVSEFSGGMKRRTAIVRAVMADSDLVLLDEPFKGIDEEQKRDVIRWLLHKLEGKTVVLVTHEEEDAKLMGAECVVLK